MKLFDHTKQPDWNEIIRVTILWSLFMLIMVDGVLVGWLFRSYQYEVDYTCYCKEIKSDMSILGIAREHANMHKYNIDTFNCLDYSKSLVNAYEGLNYNASIVTGWVNHGVYYENPDPEPPQIPLSLLDSNETYGHAWVRVCNTTSCMDIEATTGDLIGK